MKKIFIDVMTGADGKYSFGVAAAGTSLIYFMVQDAWYFHRTGQLVATDVVAAHLAFGIAWYGVKKYSEFKGVPQ